MEEEGRWTRLTNRNAVAGSHARNWANLLSQVFYVPTSSQVGISHIQKGIHSHRSLKYQVHDCHAYARVLQT